MSFSSNALPCFFQILAAETPENCAFVLSVLVQYSSQILA
ncbi:hypothetical protein T4C_8438, partial [Trichinella pseudospiralis]